MNTDFVVLGMNEIEEYNQLEVEVMVGEEKRVYRLSYTWIGVRIPGELENIITMPAVRSKKFIDLVFSFHEGNVIDFPVGLTCS